MTESEYRKHSGISRTELWKIKDSPEKFKWFQEHPEEPTPSLIFGAMAHKLLLEPDAFDNEFAVAPSCDRRTKDGREAYNKFLSEADGKTVVAQADYDIAVSMIARAVESSFVAKLLNGERENPFFWVDQLTGESCKIRVDCLTQIGEDFVIIDYKTTTDASTDGFMRHAINLGYDFQAGMYCAGVEAVTGKKPLFVFIAQEKAEPYSVNIMQADEAFINRGYDIFRELIGTYHDCKITGNWYGYLGKYDVINNLCLPAWAAKE